MYYVRMNFRRSMLYFFIWTQSLSANIDYCQLSCQIKNNTIEHIMCTLNNDCSVGPECRVKTKFNFTRDMKYFVLDTHNFFRNEVALGKVPGRNGRFLPQAADMLEMVWDDELAYFAQCYANKCILQNDKCRQNSARENIGQLIFIRVSIKPKTIEEIITEMLEAAFDTSRYMTENEIEKHVDDKHTKEFTQLTWSRTHRIGCGFTKLLEDLFAYFMVCNYAPDGNNEGEKVYKIGPSCSRCPDNRSSENHYEGLCAATENERASLESKQEFMQVSNDNIYLQTVNANEQRTAEEAEDRQNMREIEETQGTESSITSSIELRLSSLELDQTEEAWMEENSTESSRTTEDREPKTMEENERNPIVIDTSTESSQTTEDGAVKNMEEIEGNSTKIETSTKSSPTTEDRNLEKMEEIEKNSIAIESSTESSPTTKDKGLEELEKIEQSGIEKNVSSTSMVVSTLRNIISEIKPVRICKIKQRKSWPHFDDQNNSVAEQPSFLLCLVYSFVLIIQLYK